MKSSRGFTIIELILTIILCALIGVLAIRLFGGSVKAGTRTGRVAALEQSGVFIKTWEGELTSTSIPAPVWRFRIPRSHPEILQTFQAALAGGRTVTIRYRDKFASPIAEAYQVEIVEDR